MVALETNSFFTGLLGLLTVVSGCKQTMAACFSFPQSPKKAFSKKKKKHSTERLSLGPVHPRVQSHNPSALHKFPSEIPNTFQMVHTINNPADNESCQWASSVVTVVELLCTLWMSLIWLGYENLCEFNRTDWWKQGAGSRGYSVTQLCSQERGSKIDPYITPSIHSQPVQNRRNHCGIPLQWRGLEQ